MYVTSGHSAVRGECVCTSLVGTVQYVVSVRVYVASGHSAVRGECACTSLVGTVQYVVSVCVFVTSGHSAVRGECPVNLVLTLFPSFVGFEKLWRSLETRLYICLPLQLSVSLCVFLLCLSLSISLSSLQAPEVLKDKKYHSSVR